MSDLSEEELKIIEELRNKMGSEYGFYPKINDNEDWLKQFCIYIRSRGYEEEFTYDYFFKEVIHQMKHCDISSFHSPKRSFLVKSVNDNTSGTNKNPPPFSLSWEEIQNTNEINSSGVIILGPILLQIVKARNVKKSLAEESGSYSRNGEEDEGEIEEGTIQYELQMISEQVSNNSNQRRRANVINERNRMLMLHLTDGRNGNILAMEYKTCHFLQGDLIGKKIVIRNIRVALGGVLLMIPLSVRPMNYEILNRRN